MVGENAVSVGSAKSKGADACDPSFPVPIHRSRRKMERAGGMIQFLFGDLADPANGKAIFNAAIAAAGEDLLNQISKDMS